MRRKHSGARRGSLLERFEEKYIPEPMSGCFLWTGATSVALGYGQLKRELGPTGTIDFAHRISYELFHGPIPEGLLVLHKCDNRACVNPDHLRVGTRQENAQDMARKNRGRKSPKGMPYGVYASGDLFAAAVHHEGRKFYLGTYRSIDAAANVAREYKERLYA